MDSIPQNIMQPLELLIYVSLVLLLITGVFLIKLLLDSSNLVKSLQDFLKVTQSELEPAIKEIHGTLTNINSISSSINSQFNNINSGLEKGGRFLCETSARAFKKLKSAGLNAKDRFKSVFEVFYK